jgi:flagellar basal-body rod protein FlgF
METTMFLAIARQAVLRREMESVAHNLANANTTGYKSQAPLFREVLSKTSPTEHISSVLDQGLMSNTTDGPLRNTGGNFDFGIRGPGYFAVQTPAGERYTRNGTFKLDAASRLVTHNDNAVLGADNRPITVPPTAGEIRIADDGTILAGTQIVGQMKIVGFANDRQLKRGPNSLLIANEAPQRAPAAKVVQGFIEESNVVPMFELSRITEIARNFQQTSNLIEQEHDRQRDAVRRIGKPSGAA